MAVAMIVLGVAAQVVAWSFVAVRRTSLWTTVGPVIAIAGVAAVAVRVPPLSGEVPVWGSAVAGLASGAILYAGTRVFVALVGPWWPAFVRHARAIYAEGEGRLGALTVAAAGAVAVGEELFWRGLAQRELAARFDAAVIAAAATLGLYVLANAASRNLAILAGAVVGGAVWVALAWWTGGVLASIASHATWTALMLLRPAVGGAR